MTTHSDFYRRADQSPDWFSEAQYMSDDHDTVEQCLDSFSEALQNFCCHGDYRICVQVYATLIKECRRSQSYSALESANRLVFEALSERRNAMGWGYLVSIVGETAQKILSLVDRREFSFSFYFAPKHWYKTKEKEFKEFPLPLLFYVANCLANNGTIVFREDETDRTFCFGCDNHNYNRSKTPSIAWYQFLSLFPAFYAKETDPFAFLICAKTKFPQLDVFPRCICFSAYIERENRLVDDDCFVKREDFFHHVFVRLSEETWISEVRKWIKFANSCPWNRFFPELSDLFCRVAPFPFEHPVLIQLLEILKSTLCSADIQTLLLEMVDVDGEKGVSLHQIERIGAISFGFGFALSEMETVLFKIAASNTEYYLDIVKNSKTGVSRHVETALALYRQEEVDTEDVTAEVWACLSKNTKGPLCRFLKRLSLEQALLLCPKVLFGKETAFEEHFPAPPENWTEEQWLLFFTEFELKIKDSGLKNAIDVVFNDAWAKEILFRCTRMFSDTPKKILDCFIALRFGCRKKELTLEVHQILIDEFANMCSLAHSQLPEKAPLFSCSTDALPQADSLENVTSVDDRLLAFLRVIADVELLYLMNFLEAQNSSTDTESTDSLATATNSTATCVETKKNSGEHRFFLCCVGRESKITLEMLGTLSSPSDVLATYKTRFFESLFIALLANKVSDGNKTVTTQKTGLSLHLLTQFILQEYRYSDQEAALLLQVSALLSEKKPPCGVTSTWVPFKKWVLDNRVLWTSSLVSKQFVDEIVPTQHTADNWFELRRLYPTANDKDPLDFAQCKFAWDFLNEDNRKVVQQVYFTRKPTETLLGIGPWADATVFKNISSSNINVAQAQKMISIYEGELSDLSEILAPLFGAHDKDGAVPAIVSASQSIEDQLWECLLNIAPNQFFTKQCVFDALVDSNQAYKTCLFMQFTISLYPKSHPKLLIPGERKQKTPLCDSIPLSFCSICMLEKATHAVTPCGHLCLCQECSPDIANCPICRKGSARIVKIYFS